MTDNFLANILFNFLFLWILTDVIFYFYKVETFSQWVIKRSKQDKVFAFLTFSVIVFAAGWLIVHWELIDIVFLSGKVLSGEL